MRTSLRRHLPILVTAVIVAVLMQAGPPVAAAVYDAVNADKVDGRHAVASWTTAADRAGKLVATNAYGRLPNDIIATAPNAGKLGGQLPGAYLRNSPDTVTGVQVQDGSLGRADLGASALTPRAFGLVRFDGALVEERPYSGLTAQNIVSPPDTAGVYCIINLDFIPVTVSVSGSLVFSGPSLPFASLGAGAGCESVPGTQITVLTFAAQPVNGSNPPTDGSFDLQVWSYS